MGAIVHKSSDPKLPPSGPDFKPPILKKELSVGIRQQLIRNNSMTNIWEKYEKVKVLGSGMNGEVFEVKRKGGDESSDRYAVKSVNKNKVKKHMLDGLRDEIKILKQLDHPDVIKLYETFEDADCIYLVIEVCSGGELFERLKKSPKKRFEEPVAKIYMKQIVQAVAYVHEMGICHRDLKLENFLCESPDNYLSIKLIDFGLSKKYADIKAENLKGVSEEETNLNSMTSMVGTPYYMAPEIFGDKGYDVSCDMWGVGVICYILLSGKPPFNGKTDGAIFKKIMEADYDFRGDAWKEVSTKGKDFIAKCLRQNPAQRLTAKKAMHHHWFEEGDRKGSMAEDLDPKILASMSEFKKEGDFKKISTSVLAFGLSQNEIKDMKEAFLKIDLDGNGTITLEELCESFKGVNLTMEEIKGIFEGIDQDGTGRISYSEFVACTLKRQIKVTETRWRQAFDMMDMDKSGFIDEHDLKTLVAGDAEGEEEAQRIKEMIQHADKSKDGKIAYHEFLEIMIGDGQKAIDEFVEETQHSVHGGYSPLPSRTVSLKASLPSPTSGLRMDPALVVEEHKEKDFKQDSMSTSPLDTVKSSSKKIDGEINKRQSGEISVAAAVSPVAVDIGTGSHVDADSVGSTT